MNGLFKAFSIVVLTAALSACAASRSVVTLDQPKVAPTVQAQGVVLKIVQVTDARYFDPAPPNPDTPSLSKEDINNDSLKARAIGRKRNGYGMAMGDVLLPEGMPVTGVVRTAVANGFKSAGYRIVEPDDVAYGQAVPLDVRINKFWCWFQPGFWSVKVHNAAEVEITGPLQPIGQKLIVQGGAVDSMMAVTEDDWQKIASKGLSSLTQNSAAALQGKPQQPVVLSE